MKRKGVNRIDVTSSLFWLGISIFVGAESIDIGIGALSMPGPGFVLFGASFLLAVLSIIQLIKSFVGKGEAKLLSDPFLDFRWEIALAAMAAVLLYTLFLEQIGFLLMTLALLTLLFTLGGVNKLISFGGATVTVIISYLIFYFGLQVQLPIGILSWWH